MFKRLVAFRPLNRHACRSRSLISVAVAAAIAGTTMPAGAQESGGDQGLSEVTITGSRIVRRDLEASSPVVTVDSGALENSSTIGVESVLNTLPQFRPAGGTQFVAGDVQASAFNNPGISSVN